ncbi:endonuclease domain-containing protein [Paenibacillus harenae]|uniref:endonuclease domain-containing protein n=1 Tax=Paenibacillus harenae TaxID=306543 RepID=UPI00278EA4BA|nr:DUF559 domain-containing protein [Paenibacillus harenae]MDQ0062353.1 very-short-patch-repair endonuclease [Paenibacillus harenae]
MTKDYEYWRRVFITRVTDHLYETINAIERNIESPIERIAALEALKFRDTAGEITYKIMSQYPVGPYKADVVVTGPDKKVAIECDGHEFHEKTKSQAARDKKRDREFQKEGYIILRYTGSEIVNDPTVIRTDLFKIFGVTVNKLRE